MLKLFSSSVKPLNEEAIVTVKVEAIIETKPTHPSQLIFSNFLILATK